MNSLHTFLVAAEKSGSGKTTITTGIIAHLASLGRRVAPFKSGPDYIDTLHHEKAAGRVAYNLDPVLTGSDDAVRRIFARGTDGADVAVIEGVMGIFDGIDATHFTGSSFHVARITGAPLLLVLDCAGSSFTPAATLRGILSLLDSHPVAGVVLNNIASARHELLVRRAIETHAGVPVLGAVPKGAEELIPSRHLGIHTAPETDGAYYESCRNLVSTHIDINSLLSRATVPRPDSLPTAAPTATRRALVARDEAFQFYYRANLDTLQQMGYEVSYFSPLAGERITPCDLLYLGGGYPERFARELARHRDVATSIRKYADQGGRIYAECGGLMYLTRGIQADGVLYPMCGVIQADCVMQQKRAALGYVKCTPTHPGLAGDDAVGHEFHYSTLTQVNDPYVTTTTRLTDGKKGEDGFLKGNCYATYTHHHFGAGSFIDRFVRGY